MGGERPKWISNMLAVFKKNPEKQSVTEQEGSRFVKDTEITIDGDKVSVDEIQVELMPSQPDEAARVIARCFRTGRTCVGNYNSETGKFDIQELD